MVGVHLRCAVPRHSEMLRLVRDWRYWSQPTPGHFVGRHLFGYGLYSDGYIGHSHSTDWWLCGRVFLALQALALPTDTFFSAVSTHTGS